jgi:ATP-dependent Clp protease ATP-binding subunit ClpA
VNIDNQLEILTRGVKDLISEDELKNKLKGLNSHLKEHILGQDHVADIVADTIWPKTLGADLHPERPNGVFLFVGPTGVGKTEFARELARYLFGSLDKLIRIDMSEYSEANTVAKLLGAPFGYRGYEKGSPVLNEIEEKPFSILLLDEFEKAHPEIHKLFLQVFDSGVLTDTDRHHVYFSDVIIIMTSNISVDQKPSVGFISEEKTKQVQEKMTKYFVPEFVNRIDYICVFNRLSKKTAEDIVKTRIFPLVEEKWIEKGFKISVKPEVISFIVDQGYSGKWGARNLERTVDKLISSPLAKFMQDIEKKEKKKIEISIKNGSIQIS